MVISCITRITYIPNLLPYISVINNNLSIHYLFDSVSDQIEHLIVTWSTGGENE